ncbi:MAG: InlB B-repeat-containing protein [Candidatus Bathyarchaeia archaeon]
MKKLILILLIASILTANVALYRATHAESTVIMTVNYVIIGGGAGYAPPTFHYVNANGEQANLTLTQTPTAVTVLSSSSWSVTPTSLAGSRENERWCTGETASGTASSVAITFTFYHQYKVNASFSTSDGSTPPAEITLSSVSLGGTLAAPLQRTTTFVWLDADSNWTVTNAVTATSGTERWYTTNATSGTVTSTTVIAPHYHHQYKVTFTQSGLGQDTSGAIVTVNDATTIESLPSSLWADAGNPITFNYTPEIPSALPNKKYVLSETNATSPLPVSAATTITANYTTRYLITVTSPHGNPTKTSQWVNAGDTFTVSVTDPHTVTPGHQWRLTAITLDGAAQPLSNSVTLTNIQAPHNIAFTWTEQYIISASAATPNGQISPSGSIPTNAGDNQTFTITPNAGYHTVNVIVDGTSMGPITTYTFTNIQSPHQITATFEANPPLRNVTFTVTGLPNGTRWSVTVGNTTLTSTSKTLTVRNLPTGVYPWNITSYISSSDGTRYSATTPSGYASTNTVTVTYTTQYSLTVISPYGTTSGSGWYNKGATAHASLNTAIINENDTVTHTFTGWSGDATGTELTSNPIIMDNPKTAIANWVNTYHLNITNFNVTIETNSPLNQLTTNNTELHLTVDNTTIDGAADTAGYLNIIIPKTLDAATIKVFLDGIEVTPQLIPGNTTDTLCITYPNKPQTITISNPAMGTPQNQQDWSLIGAILLLIVCAILVLYLLRSLRKSTPTLFDYIKKP